MIKTEKFTKPFLPDEMETSALNEPGIHIRNDFKTDIPLKTLFDFTPIF